jgi:TPR repeat protein
MSWTAYSRALNNRLSWKKERRRSPSNKETTMTIFARTLAVLLAAFLWSGAAHADLDDIRKAAEGGDNEAQLELGVLFQYGFNYKGNEIPALTWYMLSANQGNAKAAQLRDALKSKMTEKEVQEAVEQVAQYKPSGKPPATPPPPASAPAPAAEAPVDFSPPPSTEAKPAEVEPVPVPPPAQ